MNSVFKKLKLNIVAKVSHTLIVIDAYNKAYVCVDMDERTYEFVAQFDTFYRMETCLWKRASSTMAFICIIFIKKNISLNNLNRIEANC